MNEQVFDGSDYDHERDHVRLETQLAKVFNLMKDGRWRSLTEIENETGAPQASVSAQLRNLRKERFGGHTVNKKYVHDGLYVYQLIAKGHQQTIDYEEI